MKTFYANWLPFHARKLVQRPLTKVHEFFSHRNFFIDGVNPTIRVEIRPPVVEYEGRQFKKRKSKAEHKPANGIANRNA